MPRVCAQSVMSRLEELRARMIDQASAPLDGVHPEQARSLANLQHYLAMRRADVRQLQEDLRRLGLSSLGRAEPAAMATVDAVLRALGAMTGARFEHVDAIGGGGPGLGGGGVIDFDEGDELIRSRATALLGADRLTLHGAGRSSRIMVTLPSSAAADPAVVFELVEAGMDVARINAAHDDEAAWSAMIENLRRAESRLELPARPVLLDLPGPNPRIGPMPVGVDHVRVRAGDRVILSARGASLDVEAPGIVLSCTLPEVLGDCRVGQRVVFDDGRVEARVESAGVREVELVVTEAGGVGGDKVVKLKAGKGINLPETELSLPSITEQDRAALRFVAERSADGVQGRRGRGVSLVGLSFIRRAADVHACLDELDRLGAEGVGLVMKIETRAAFDHLPSVLVASMRRSASAVMIARGDLAVELGVERLAEAQEEILWLCEAAHTPVIWATQVLETLAKTGRATRSEVTDAAMAGRAECVMLNKGPRIVQAVRTLDGILRRMHAHQVKKRSVLRPLGMAERYRPSGLGGPAGVAGSDVGVSTAGAS